MKLKRVLSLLLAMAMVLALRLLSLLSPFCGGRLFGFWFFGS